MGKDDDIGNKDLQLVHKFLKEQFYRIVDDGNIELSDEDRVRWGHAIQVCGSIGYQYRVERLERDYVKKDNNCDKPCVIKRYRLNEKDLFDPPYEVTCTSLTGEFHNKDVKI